MSILSSKTKESQTKAPAKSKAKAAPPKSSKTTGQGKGAYAHVLLAPRITEKAALSSERGAYVFTVASNATKVDVKKAFFQVYGILPRKVTMTRIPKKNTFIRGRRGTKGGGKKAVVYLPEGQKIEIV
jgi:large subunit ribosomal protein L23